MEKKVELLNARKFNNFVKNEIIKKYKCNSLLDLACGKGGDMHKWISNKIKLVKGYDIDKDSIKEAKLRYAKIKNKDKGKFTFQQIDLSNTIIEPKIKFDVVSCFFAIHYFFKNEITFMYFISNIINNIKKNGYFMMSTFSEDKLKELNYKVNTETFKVNPINIKSNKIFGKSISVWIKDSVLDKEREEYVVPFNYLVAKLSEYNIQLVKSGNFRDFYNHKKIKLNNIEKLLCFLNIYSVFKKI